MSYYATNFIIDMETGELKLVKHLNKVRIDRCGAHKSTRGWNKSGSKSRSHKKCIKTKN